MPPAVFKRAACGSPGDGDCRPPSQHSGDDSGRSRLGIVLLSSGSAKVFHLLPWCGRDSASSSRGCVPPTVPVPTALGERQQPGVDDWERLFVSAAHDGPHRGMAGTRFPVGHLPRACGYWEEAGAWQPKVAALLTVWGSQPWPGLGGEDGRPPWPGLGGTPPGPSSSPSGRARQRMSDELAPYRKRWRHLQVPAGFRRCRAQAGLGGMPRGQPPDE
jgi:hypothetical protein